MRGARPCSQGRPVGEGKVELERVVGNGFYQAPGTALSREGVGRRVLGRGRGHDFVRDHGTGVTAGARA